MNVKLAYGDGYLDADLPADCTTIIEPLEQPGLPEEKESFLAALDAPIGTGALRERVGNGERICIVFTDITRATPNERIIPWTLEYLRGCGVGPERVTLLNALGTHRPNTPEQLATMLTEPVMRDYRVLNHEPENPAELVRVGVTTDGTPALLNRHLMEADTRIVTGFIEPHFFAGFSGGPKGIMPGVAALETVISNHGRRNIGNPNAAFGITEGNPLWEELRDIALKAGPSFLINVTLNERRAITGIFAGDLLAAHKVGIEFVRKSAMQPVDDLFDIVITTNSGYPLDQNLYQAVKGMSAAARIVKKGGAIVMAAECRAGVPDGSPFQELMNRAKDPEDILSLIARETFPEQWQSQIQALIQRKAQIHLHSSLPGQVVSRAHLIPAPDIAATVRRLAAERGGTAKIAVLPQGPLTIPYLAR
ncbi:MAG TPA: nickel-dependent lactate racemase [Chthoniobacteraceae bacterium]|nr:nickel-dependent lactate racemase [Chthoniobacteraceae bacterium]